MANQLNPEKVHATNREIIGLLKPEYIEPYNVVLSNFTDTFTEFVALDSTAEKQHEIDGALRRLVAGAIMYAFEAGRDEERNRFLGGEQ